MSTITPTNIDTTAYGNVMMKQWAFTGADTGVGVLIPDWPDKSISITGTWNGATVGVDLSNDGTNWVPACDPQGNAISKTADFIETILDNALYVRPRTTAGTPTALTVILIARR